MKFPDLTTHTASVALLAMFTVIFMVAAFIANAYHATPETMKTLMIGSFSNFSGALLLALRGSGSGPSKPNDPPPPPPGA